MWIVLNNAFLSIVQPSKFDKPKPLQNADVLMVRARRKVDITRTFPAAKVLHWKGRDYPFRAFIERAAVAAVIAKSIADIDYGNFKNSVKEDDRHDAYSAVWGVMHRWQQGAYARKPYNAADERDFSWGRGEPVVLQRDDGPTHHEEDEEGCDAPGCSIDTPCQPCLTSAIQALEADRYGDYDEDEDAHATSALRIAPR